MVVAGRECRRKKTRRVTSAAQREQKDSQQGRGAYYFAGTNNWVRHPPWEDVFLRSKFHY
jgi:hypothetical protein